MNPCEHHKRVGDNYGNNCQDCGVVLEGYMAMVVGSGSNLTGRERCIHAWWQVSAGQEECTYYAGHGSGKRKPINDMKKLIKNYTTDIPVERTIAEIQQLLAHNGARGIAIE